MMADSCMASAECSGLVTDSLAIDYLRLTIIGLLLITSIILINKKSKHRTLFLITSLVILGFIVPTCTCDFVIIQAVISFITSAQPLAITISLVSLAIIITLFTLFYGRSYCGWVCPLGAAQELINKLTRKELISNKWKSRLQYIKYGVLLLMIPLTLIGVYIQGPTINVNKFINASVLLTTIILLLLSLITYRPWCNYFCPFGAMLGLISKLSFNKIRLTKGCDKCNACGSACGSNAIINGRVTERECIKCGKCVKACSLNSLKIE